MQTEDSWLMHNPGKCPRCNMPLARRGTLQPQNAMVMCPSCGFSAPSVLMTGQQQVEMPAANILAGTQVALASPPSSGSSVWIDPSVSAFLGGRLIIKKKTIPQTGFSYPKLISP